MAPSSRDRLNTIKNSKKRRRELAGLRNTAANAGPPSSSKTFGTKPPRAQRPDMVESFSNILGAYASKGVRKVLPYTFAPFGVNLGRKVTDFIMPEYSSRDVRKMSPEERKQASYDVAAFFPGVGGVTDLKRTEEERGPTSPWTIGTGGLLTADITPGNILSAGVLRGAKQFSRFFDGPEDDLMKIPRGEELPGEKVDDTILQQDDAADILVREADEALISITKDNPDLAKLIEENPDRAIRLQRLYNIEERVGGFDPGVKAALENITALNNLASDIPVGNFNLTGVSDNVILAVRRGENPVALLLDDKLKPRDFNLGGEGYTLSYEPLNIDEYGKWQSRTASAGERKMRGTARNKTNPRNINVRKEEYDEALAAGMVPHRVKVTGGKEGKVKKEYKGWWISGQQEHSIPKSPAGKIWDEYVNKQRALYYSLAKKAGRKKPSGAQFKQINDLKSGDVAKELSAIINAEDTLISFPAYYNNMKSNYTTSKFKEMLKQEDPEAYKRFYDDSDFARSLSSKQDILMNRLYNWKDKYNIPNDVVEDILAYI